MSLINTFISWVIRQRVNQIELFMKHPMDVQMDWFVNLITKAEKTEFGRMYDFSSIHSYDQFRQRLPVNDYEKLKPFIERMMMGESNILWPEEVKWFAKSSGTTSDKSKFIPITEDSLENCHFKGGKDLLSIYCNNYPDTRIFAGKGLTLGGSHQMNAKAEYAKTSFGDLSAIIMENLPVWVEFIRTPDLSTALMSEWEEKLDRIARITIEEDVTNLAGVPSWMMVLLQYILSITGKSTIREIWPNLELFMHGGVNFTPYREQFYKLIPDENMHYLETYNASEGFFGIQDQKNSDELLLMLDYGIFYEFIEVHEAENDNPKVYWIDEVKTNVQYAMLITTNGGLWRYKIGDTITFTSVKPYRIKITGRTKHFINTFGEELIIDNAEQALKYACNQTDAVIKEYTAGPIYMSDSAKGAHEWLIEFEKYPTNLIEFTKHLDNRLKSLNSDYEAKRYKDITLNIPVVRAVREGTFYDWLKHKGKLGGQNKVPRLCNNRQYIEEIKQFA